MIFFLIYCTPPSRTGEAALYAYQISDAEETKIHNLPKFQLLYRSQEQGGIISDNVHILHLSDEDIILQEELIDNMNATFSSTARSRFDSPQQYFPRHKLCLDHNSIPSFHDRYTEICNNVNSWRANIAFQSTDLLLYLGEPRNMEPIHHELLRNGQAENMLLYGNYAKSLERMASIVASVISSAEMQKWPIEIWSDENDSLAKIVLRTWHSGKIINNPFSLLTQVKQLNQQIKERTLTKRFIIITGLSSIVHIIRAEIEERNMFGAENTMDESGFQRIRDLMARGGVEEPQDNENRIEDISAYLSPLLKFGPRHDVHFLVVIQKESELNDASISLDHFSHYSAFANGIHDTQYFQLKRRVDRISDDDMFGCLTGNGDFTVYTPFALQRKEK